MVGHSVGVGSVWWLKWFEMRCLALPSEGRLFARARVAVAWASSFQPAIQAFKSASMGASPVGAAPTRRSPHDNKNALNSLSLAGEHALPVWNAVRPSSFANSDWSLEFKFLSLNTDNKCRKHTCLAAGGWRCCPGHDGVCRQSGHRGHECAP